MPPRSAQLPSTIPQLVEEAGKQFGDACFIHDDDVVLSFATFASVVHRVAAALLQRGIKKGDRVAVWAPNIHEWVLAGIGAQCAGAILVTINTRYKGSEAAYILRESQARVLFCMGEFLGADYPAMLEGESLPQLEHQIIFRSVDIADHDKRESWDSFLQGAGADSDADIAARIASIGADDTADILFTSGTTGAPKGVMTGHGQNVRAFHHFTDIGGFGPDDRYLVVNPFFHSFGYKAGILACLIRGTRLLPHAVFDVDSVLQRIAAEKITVLPGPPTLFQSLLAHPQRDDYDLSSLRFATTGAASIPVTMIEQMHSELGFERVITAYGLTECCGLATMCRAGDSAATIATTSGRAIPETEVRCVDPQGDVVPAGEPGEIVVRGFNVMQGYFGNPEATNETIDEMGWLHTGDIGILDAAGNLRITDRLKDMFISGGFNCYPAEIENTLAGHPAIAMSAVIGIPDERLGEVAKAFVVLKNGQPLGEAELITWCREHMANYKCPRQVAFVDALPLNASGKVLKTELRGYNT